MTDYLHHLLLVYATYFVAVASPGPSIMSIMGMAMNHGREPEVALAMGVVTGIVSWAVLAATGISTVLIAYAEAVFLIKLAGGAYRAPWEEIARNVAQPFIRAFLRA